MRRGMPRHAPFSVSTVNGSSVSSTRQFTVGRMKDVARCGTPKKPSSRKGISNSRLSSLRGARAEGALVLAQASSQCARRRRHSPKVALPDVLLHALDELVELLVRLVAALALALLLLDLVGVVHGPAAGVERLHRVHDLGVELHVVRLLLAHLREREEEERAGRVSGSAVKESEPESRRRVGPCADAWAPTRGRGWRTMMGWRRWRWTSVIISFSAGW